MSPNLSGFANGCRSCRVSAPGTVRTAGIVPPTWCTSAHRSTNDRIASQVDSAMTLSTRDEPETGATTVVNLETISGCAELNRLFTYRITSTSTEPKSASADRSRTVYSSLPPTSPGTSQRRLTPTRRCKELVMPSPLRTPIAALLQSCPT